MRDYIVPLREKLSKRWPNLQLKAVATGSQPFILWKNAQLATHRTSCDPDELYVAGRARARAACPAGCARRSRRWAC